ncbi:MAG: helix-turn-helix transcriptional regulator [Chloroflexota bacterium]|nr:helix-turn-helix transcriptional regulator [Chloroflexota bacterium]
MDELEDNQDLDESREIEGDDAIGPLLRKLRGDLSLRDVTGRIGVSSSYLSQIERGDRQPGSNVVRKLAALYNVDAQELMKRAGRDPYIDPYSDEAMEVERAYQYVLADPAFRVGTRPDGPITLKTKRFIVEMYERFANKRLLE